MVVLHTRSVHTQTSNLGLHSLSISLLRQSHICLWSYKSLLGRNAASANRAKVEHYYAHRSKIVWERCHITPQCGIDHVLRPMSNCSAPSNAIQTQAQKHYLPCVANEIHTKLHILSKHIHNNINICKRTQPWTKTELRTRSVLVMTEITPKTHTNWQKNFIWLMKLLCLVEGERER